MEDLKKEVMEFSKSKLKKTETRITTPGGQTLIEKKDDRGRMVTTNVNQTRWGFVGDLRRDLQVGEIRPGLILGRSTMFCVQRML